MTGVPVPCPVRRDLPETHGEQRRQSRSRPGQELGRSAVVCIRGLPNWGWPSTRPPPGVAFPSVRRSLEAPCAHHRFPAAERAGPWWRSGGHLGADPPGFGTGLEETAGLLCGGGFDARRAARPLEMASRRAPPVPVRSGKQRGTAGTDSRIATGSQVTSVQVRGHPHTGSSKLVRHGRATALGAVTATPRPHLPRSLHRPDQSHAKPTPGTPSSTYDRYP